MVELQLVVQSYLGKKLDNMKIDQPTITDFTNATHTHVSNATGGTLTQSALSDATATPTASKIVVASASGKVDGWVSPASDTVSGISELATSAEITAGTDTGRTITPDALSGSDYGKRTYPIYVFEGSTALSTGDGKAYIPVPPEIGGWNVIAVGATLIGSASSSGTPTVQIARGRQPNATTIYSYVDVLSTRITIDANEWHSRFATSSAVIDTSNDDLAIGDILRVDVDVAGTGATGLIVYITAQLP